MATYTLPSNKILATLSNLIVLMRTSNIHQGTGVNRLLDFCRSDDLTTGGVKAILTANEPSVSEYSKTSSVTKVSDPSVTEEFLETKGGKFIPLSINRYITKQAMLNDYNMAEFSGYLIATMDSAERNYMWNQLVTLIKGWTPTLTTQKVAITLTDTSKLTDASAIEHANVLNAKEICKKLIKLTRAIEEPSAKYNDLGYTSNVASSDLTLIINDKYDVDLVCDTFATLFGSSAIENRFDFRKSIPIGEDTINDASKIGWLFQKDKVQYGYSYKVMTSFFDASNLYENNFLHFDYYMGIVKGLVGVAITKA